MVKNTEIDLKQFIIHCILPSHEDLIVGMPRPPTFIHELLLDSARNEAVTSPFNLSRGWVVPVVP